MPRPAWASPPRSSTRPCTTPFGQRLISTIFTQSAQYRVVLEVQPQFSHGPDALSQIYVPTATAAAGAAVQRRAHRANPARCWRSTAWTSSPMVDRVVQPGAGRVAVGRGGRHPCRANRTWACPPASRRASRAPRQAFQNSLTSTLWLILAAIVTMYIVLGVLYESFIHPVTILSTLPSAGVGALLALLLSRTGPGHDSASSASSC